MGSSSAAYIGIDLTCTPAKPSACAVLGERGEFLDASVQRADQDIIDYVLSFRPAIVAIDSPLGFPRGMCCLEDSCPCESVHDFKGRTAERELLRSGVRLYITTKKTFIKPMIYRAIRIAETLRTDGIEAIEVYPYAAKRALFGPDIPPKTTRAGIEFLRARLLLLVPDLGGSGERLTHDGCDALLAAHTAWLHSAGRTVSYGDADEVPIVAPVSA